VIGGGIDNKELQRLARDKEIQEADGDTSHGGQTVANKHRLHPRMTIVCSLTQVSKVDGKDLQVNRP
jgi:hypothetical protein